MEHHAPQAGDKPVGTVATDHAVCRYLADVGHVCANGQGGMLREGQVCHAEASSQLADLLAARVASDADLARQDAMAAAEDARLTACEHWHEELS